ncbi:MAG: hypothetical protein M3020_09510, partial [Myxococcota bacterium]|nr:hypothetical protein [Myxococcota bacterium]
MRGLEAAMNFQSPSNAPWPTGSVPRASEENKARSIGKACHIHAAAKGGPRFDETQTPEQRRDAANGIW